MRGNLVMVKLIILIITQVNGKMMKQSIGMNVYVVKAKLMKITTLIAIIMESVILVIIK